MPQDQLIDLRRYVRTQTAEGAATTLHSMASNTSSGVSAAKGCRPVHNSYNNAPSEYTSEALVAVSPRSISGGMYNSVPDSVPEIVPDAARRIHIQPHRPFKAGQAEVQNLQHAVFAEHDVLRLDVAVEDPGRMGRGHCTSRLSTPIDGLR